MSSRLAVSFVALSALAACKNTAPAPAAAVTESPESAAQHEAFARAPSEPTRPVTAPTETPAAAAPAAPRAPFDPAHPSAGGITWTVPEGFTYRAPASEMRLAEYIVGRVGDSDVALSLFHFPGMGGTIDANLQRWIGQFTQPDGSSTLAQTHSTTITVGALRVTTIETHGHFEGGSMGGGNGDDYRLLGAIVEAPEGPVFFKLVGPRAVVDAAEARFQAMVRSVARTTP